jgi:predicted alpha/beta-fold hydrolase
MDKLVPQVGVNVVEVMSNIHTITEFDHGFITPLHG